MYLRQCRAVLRICRRSRICPQNSQPFTCRSHKTEESKVIAPCTHFTQLLHRSLVNVKGQDGVQLLQGLVTGDVPGLHPGGSLYSMLLNAQGRVLYDIILYCHGDGHHVIECDSRVSGDIVKHIKRYALRSKVDVSKDDSSNVWVAYPGQPVNLPPANNLLLYLDPRVSSFGSRILAPSSISASEISSNLTLTSVENYHRHRLEAGIPEGPDEIPVGACFPLEYNLDFCNGVSFSKGCYLGQELTARTHHTGVIRKRIMPVSWQGELSGVTVPSGSKLVNSSRKNVGKLISHLGSIGLALLRVQDVGCVPLSFQSEEHQDLHVTAHTPNWWPEASSS